MNKPHSITLFYSHSYSQKIIVLWNPGRVWLRCIVILSSYELTWKLIHNSSRLNSNLNKHFNNPSHFGDILNFWYFELFQKIVHTTSTSCIIPLYSTNILVCHFFFLMIHQAQKNANTWLRYILNHWRLNEKNFLLGYPTLCSSFLIEIFFFPLKSSIYFYLKAPTRSQSWPSVFPNPSQGFPRTEQHCKKAVSFGLTEFSWCNVNGNSSVLWAV